MALARASPPDRVLWSTYMGVVIMAAPVAKTKHEREQHLSRVSALRCRGLTQHEIASATGRARSTIARDIDIVEQRWYEASTASIAKIKSRLIQRHEQLAKEAWEAWVETTDPRHFANALAATKGLREIIGTDAPKKTATELSGSVEHRHVEELSDDDLASFANGEFELDGETGDAILGGTRVVVPQEVA